MNQFDHSSLAAILGNAKVISELANSPDAQALVSMLAKTHDQAGLEQMAQNAVKGDMRSMQELLRSVVQDPQGQELLRRLSEGFQKE